MRIWVWTLNFTIFFSLFVLQFSSCLFHFSAVCYCFSFPVRGSSVITPYQSTSFWILAFLPIIWLFLLQQQNHAANLRDVFAYATRFDSVKVETSTQLACHIKVENPVPHKTPKSDMDQIVQTVEPLKQFAKDSIRLVKRCTKPDKKGKNSLKFQAGNLPISVWKKLVKRENVS